ncbi:hypothetical protein RRG08_050914 [Elysia crispata]|uniref:Uncharacterized protein n=1 Tax=Elysia crispata TaxID=231223 RepID=A0AAE0ZSH4_9GAST|nr:hypothetical protein RRG08_050914 [Elysia crispata]
MASHRWSVQPLDPVLYAVWSVSGTVKMGQAVEQPLPVSGLARVRAWKPLDLGLSHVWSVCATARMVKL